MSRENIFKRIFQWNRHRDNLEYDKYHEGSMLDEELVEYLQATNFPNELKELADIIFVAVGGLTKAVGYKKAQAILDVVMIHNEAKGSEKVNGKIVKVPVDWKAEDRIKEIIDQNRPVQTQFDYKMYPKEGE